MKDIVIFASGSGSNAEAIIQYFRKNDDVQVSAVLCNKREAQVIDRCNRLNISCLVFNRTALYEKDLILKVLLAIDPDLIILAGFLWKVPEKIIEAFPDRIVNIHPALLPKYGGKGMYGMRVHETVLKNAEKESGITIHYVNENYDEGAIIEQVKVGITEEDTPRSLAEKVHVLEHAHYPKVIANLLKQG